MNSRYQASGFDPAAGLAAASDAVAWRGADVLMLSPTATHPQDYGNRKRIFRICHDLTARGARITFVHYPAESEWRTRLPPSSQRMARTWHACYTVPVTVPLHPPAVEAEHTIDEWWDPAIGDFLSWLFQVATFDVFIVNYTWLSRALLLAPANVFRILDTHDRVAGRRLLLERNGISREFFHTTDEQERLGLERADLIWAIKPQEATEFAQLTAVPVVTLPYIDPMRPLPAPAEDPDGYLRVGIVAARNNVNLTNLRRFLAAAIPVFDRFFAPIKLLVAGSICDWLYNVDERFVTLVGRIGNVEDFYRTLDAVCIPVEFSTGQKIKTGEAIGFGMPIVALAHGFEGYTPTHPLHSLAHFTDMAERLVELAFDRSGLNSMRSAALDAAQATRQEVNAALERTWSLAGQARRVAIFCVAAAAFDAAAPEHLAFDSTVRMLHTLVEVEVLVVAGPVEALLTSCYDIDIKIRLTVAAALPGAILHAAILADLGFEIAPAAHVLNRFADCIIILDAIPDPPLDVVHEGGAAVLRAALAFAAGESESSVAMLAGFPTGFAQVVVMAPQPCAAVGRLAQATHAAVLRAPCCCGKDLLRRRFGGRRQPREVAVLYDGRMAQLNRILHLLRFLGLQPNLILPAGQAAPQMGPAPRGLPLDEWSADSWPAPHYLRALTGGGRPLPGFAVDLSRGALGLQYAVELLRWAEVPVIMADVGTLHPSLVPETSVTTCHSYEQLCFEIIRMAHRGPTADIVPGNVYDAGSDGTAIWTWVVGNCLEQIG